jgi:hypothetical protein
MAPRKSLYQLLEVSADAGPEVVKAAYEARTAQLAGSPTIDAKNDRAILAGAFEVLADPARRKQYDEWLREERRRALTSGGTDEERPRPANASAMQSGSRTGLDMTQVMFGLAALVLACGAGAWVYFDHVHKVAAQRLEAERIALEAKKREEDAAHRSSLTDWAKDRADAAREAAEARQLQMASERARQQLQREQQRANQLMGNEERNRLLAQQRAEQQRQREEQESLRRSQQQLQREKRYLQELENNRTMKF